MLTQKEHTIAKAWQIDNLKKVLVEIEKDPKEVLSIILDIWSIYIGYFDQVIKANKKHDEIYTCVLRLE